MELISTLFCQRLRDSLVRQNLRLGDHLAVGFFRLSGDLVGLGDRRQGAMLKLVRAASRCQGSQPEPYLRRCISGAMLHHLRDRELLARLQPKRRDARPGGT
ncbi:MAG: sigma factor [Synechococcaceae cyanobacterium]